MLLKRTFKTAMPPNTLLFELNKCDWFKNPTISYDTIELDTITNKVKNSKISLTICLDKNKYDVKVIGNDDLNTKKFASTVIENLSTILS